MSWGHIVPPHRSGSRRKAVALPRTRCRWRCSHLGGLPAAGARVAAGLARRSVVTALASQGWGTELLGTRPL